MAKRFTDTDKWKNAWWNGLSNTMKVVWLYINENCDHAGFWDIDIDLLSYAVKEPVTLSAIVSSFSTRVKIISDTKLHITTFIETQYRGDLNPKNKTHASVLRLLSSNQIKQLPKPLAVGAKDTDTDTDKDKDRDQDTDKDSCEDVAHRTKVAELLRIAIKQLPKGPM